jgi:hypothetical protein
MNPDILSSTCSQSVKNKDGIANVSTVASSIDSLLSNTFHAQQLVHHQLQHHVLPPMQHLSQTVNPAIFSSVSL